MPAHHGRYRFRVYLLLVLVIGIFAAVNNIFVYVLNAMGNAKDAISMTELSMELLGLAVIFAFLFWLADSRGTIGRLLGAKDAEGS